MFKPLINLLNGFLNRLPNSGTAGGASLGKNNTTTSTEDHHKDAYSPQTVPTQQHRISTAQGPQRILYQPTLPHGAVKPLPGKRLTAKDAAAMANIEGATVLATALQYGNARMWADAKREGAAHAGLMVGGGALVAGGGTVNQDDGLLALGIDDDMTSGPVVENAFSIGNVLREARDFFIEQGLPDATVSIRQGQRIRQHIERFSETMGFSVSVANALWLTLGAHLTPEQRAGTLGQGLKDILLKLNIPGIDREVYRKALMQATQPKPTEFDIDKGAIEVMIDKVTEGTLFANLSEVEFARVLFDIEPKLAIGLLQGYCNSPFNDVQKAAVLALASLADKLHGQELQSTIQILIDMADMSEAFLALDKFIDKLDKENLHALAFKIFRYKLGWSRDNRQDTAKMICRILKKMDETDRDNLLNWNTWIERASVGQGFQVIYKIILVTDVLLGLFDELDPQKYAASTKIISLLEDHMQHPFLSFNARIYAAKGLLELTNKLEQEERQRSGVGFGSTVLPMELEKNERERLIQKAMNFLEEMCGKDRLSEDAQSQAIEVIAGLSDQFGDSRWSLLLRQFVDEAKSLIKKSEYNFTTVDTVLALIKLSDGLEETERQEVLTLIEDWIEDIPRPIPDLTKDKTRAISELTRRQSTHQKVVFLQRIEGRLNELGDNIIERESSSTFALKVIDDISDQMDGATLQIAVRILEGMCQDKFSTRRIRNEATRILFEIKRRYFPEQYNAEKAMIRDRFNSFATSSAESFARITPTDKASHLSENIQVLAGVLRESTNDSTITPNPQINLSDPHFDPTLVSAHNLLNQLVQGLAINRFVLVSGPPASGKTEAGRYLGRIMGWDTQQFNCHRYLSKEAMMQRIGVVANGKTGFILTDGPLARALINGDLFILNEINLAKPGSLAFLMEILADITDGFDYFDPKLKRVVRKPIRQSFRMIATQNPEGPGRRDMNEALRNRAIEINAPEYSEIEMIALLKSRYQGLEGRFKGDKDIYTQLVSFYKAMDSNIRSSNIGDHAEGYVWNLRHLMRMAEGLQYLSEGATAKDVLNVMYETVGVSLLTADKKVFFELVKNQKYGAITITDADVAGFIERQGRLTLSEAYKPYGVDEQTAREIAQEMGIKDLPTSARYLHSILYSIEHNYHIWLKGPSGTGKSLLAVFAGRLLGAEVYLDTLTPQTGPSELKGEMKPVYLSNSDQIGFTHVPSKLVEALRNSRQNPTQKYVMILDEAAFARPDVLEELNTLLDHDGGIWVVGEDGNEEFLERGDNFQMVMVSNTYGYQGVQLQSDALRSRTNEIMMGFEYTAAEIAQLLMDQDASTPPTTPIMTGALAQSLGVALHKVREVFIEEGEGEAKVSLREVKRIRKYLGLFANKDSTPEDKARIVARALWLTLGARLKPEQRDGRLGSRLREALQGIQIPDVEAGVYQNALIQATQPKPTEFDIDKGALEAMIGESTKGSWLENCDALQFSNAVVEVNPEFSREYILKYYKEASRDDPHVMKRAMQALVNAGLHLDRLFAEEAIRLLREDYEELLDKDFFADVEDVIPLDMLEGMARLSTRLDDARKKAILDEVVMTLIDRCEDDYYIAGNAAVILVHVSDQLSGSEKNEAWEVAFRTLIEMGESEGDESRKSLGCLIQLSDRLNAEELDSVCDLLKQTAKDSEFAIRELTADLLGKISLKLSGTKLQMVLGLLTTLSMDENSINVRYAASAALVQSSQNPLTTTDKTLKKKNIEKIIGNIRDPHMQFSVQEKATAIKSILNIVGELESHDLEKILIEVSNICLSNTLNLNVLHFFRLEMLNILPQYLDLLVERNIDARVLRNVYDMLKRLSQDSSRVLGYKAHDVLSCLMRKYFIDEYQADVSRSNLRFVDLSFTTIEGTPRIDSQDPASHLRENLKVLAGVLCESGNDSTINPNPKINLSDPHFDPTLISAHNLLDQLAEGLAINRFVLVSGPPASGKTEAGRYLGRIMGWKTQQFNCHRYISEEAMMQRIGVVANGKTGFILTDGPLARALINGDLFILNEINLAKPGSLSFLMEILADITDGFDYFDPVKQRTVRTPIHPSFRMIATQNPEGPGRRDMNEALRNRAIEINAPEYSEIEMIALLKSRYQGLGDRFKGDKDIYTQLVTFYKAMDSNIRSSNIGGHAEGYVWNLRHLMRMAEGLQDLRKGATAQDVLNVMYETAGVSLLTADKKLFFELVKNQKYGAITITDADVAGFIERQGRLTLSEAYKPYGVDEQTAREIAQEMGIKDLPTSARYLHSILYSIEHNYHIWLKGPSGTGKSLLAVFAGRLLGAEVYLDTLTPQTGPSDLKGEMKPVYLSNSDQIGFTHVPSKLVEALRNSRQNPTQKYVMILDEAAFARPDVLEELNTLLDHDGGIWVVGEDGQEEFLERGDNFQLIMVSNTYGYQGVQLQSDALRSRTNEIMMGFEYTAAEIAQLLMDQDASTPPTTPIMTGALAQSLGVALHKVREVFIEEGEGEAKVSLREVKRIRKYLGLFANKDSTPEDKARIVARALWLTLGARLKPEQRDGRLGFRLSVILQGVQIPDVEAGVYSKVLEQAIQLKPMEFNVNKGALEVMIDKAAEGTWLSGVDKTDIAQAIAISDPDMALDLLEDLIPAYKGYDKVSLLSALFEVSKRLTGVQRQKALTLYVEQFTEQCNYINEDLPRLAVENMMGLIDQMPEPQKGVVLTTAVETLARLCKLPAEAAEYIRRAAEALGNLIDKLEGANFDASIKVLVGLLDDHDEHTRQEAAGKLCRILDKLSGVDKETILQKVATTLNELSNDAAPRVMADAARDLMGLSDRLEGDEWKNIIKKVKDNLWLLYNQNTRIINSHAVAAIAEHADKFEAESRDAVLEKSIAILLRRLRDGTWNRDAVIEYLGKRSHEWEGDLLQQLVKGLLATCQEIISDTKKSSNDALLTKFMVAMILGKLLEKLHEPQKTQVLRIITDTFKSLCGCVGSSDVAVRFIEGSAKALLDLSTKLQEPEKGQALQTAKDTLLMLCANPDLNSEKQAPFILLRLKEKYFNDELQAELQGVYDKLTSMLSASADTFARITPTNKASHLSENIKVLAGALRKSANDSTINPDPTINLSDPHFDPTLISAHNLLDQVVQSLAINRFVLVSGPPASGKTEAGRYLGRIMGWNTQQFNCHRYLSKEAMMQRIGVIANGKTGFILTDGPLARALINGDLFILNEINLAKPGSLSFLMEILADITDGFDYFDPLKQRTVRTPIHPSFRMIATQNPEGPGRRDMNEALRNRAIEINAPEYSEIEMIALLKSRYQGLGDRFKGGEDIYTQLVAFYKAMDSNIRSHNIGDHAEGYVWNLRHLMRMAEGLQGLREGATAQDVLSVMYETAGVSLLTADKKLFFELVKNQKYGAVTITDADVAVFLERQGRLTLNEVYKPYGVDAQTAQAIAQEMGIKDNPTTARYLRSILYSVQHNYDIWLKGPSGTGKSLLAVFAGRLLGAEVYLDTLTPQTGPSDLKGEMKPVYLSSHSKHPRIGFTHCPSKLVEALRNAKQNPGKKYLMILDEAAFARPDVLEELNTLLDHDGGIWVVGEDGQEEFLERGDNFQLIMVSNTYGYQGVQLQSDALRSRTNEIMMGFEYTAQEIDQMMGFKHYRHIEPTPSPPPVLATPAGPATTPVTSPVNITAPSLPVPTAPTLTPSTPPSKRNVPEAISPGMVYHPRWRNRPPAANKTPSLDSVDPTVRLKLANARTQYSEEDIQIIEERFSELKQILTGMAMAMGRTSEIRLEFDVNTQTMSITLESPRVMRIGPHYLLNRPPERILLSALHEGAHADISRIGSGFFFQNIVKQAFMNVMDDLRVNERVIERAPGRADTFRDDRREMYHDGYNKLATAAIPNLLPHEAFLQGLMSRQYGGTSPWDTDPVVGPAIERAWDAVQRAIAERPAEAFPDEIQVLRRVEAFEKILKEEIYPIFNELYKQAIKQVEQQLQGGAGQGGEGQPQDGQGQSQDGQGQSQDGGGPLIDPKDLSAQAKKIIQDRAGKINAIHAPSDDMNKAQAKASKIYGKPDDKPEGEPKTPNSGFKPGTLGDFLDKRHNDHKDRMEALRDKTYSRLRHDLGNLPDRVFQVFDQLLKPNTDFEYDGYFTSGPRIDVERAIKAIHGLLTDLKVFERMIEPTEKDYRFSLLLDASGSMSDGASHEKGGLGLSALFVDVFERLKMPYSLDAFHNSFVPIKGFNDTLKTTEQRNNLFNKVVTNTWGQGGTNIRDGIRGSIERIREARRTNPRQTEFLFVLTDGDETYTDGKTIREWCEEAAKEGIIVVGIGIGEGMETVKQNFPVFLVESTPENLPQLLAEFIKEYIKFQNME
ncbi:MAG: AAA family ATPase [Deltaproteobacteria bacterium]|nr:AAA family ATPase [Deltaproteobacteria bacterium]